MPRFSANSAIARSVRAITPHFKIRHQRPKLVDLSLEQMTQARQRALLRGQEQPEDVAIGGVILTVAIDGSLRIDRGFVRSENEPKPELVTTAQDDEAEEGTTEGESCSIVTPFRPAPEPEDKPSGRFSTGYADGTLPTSAPALSATLLADLEAHRTAGLQAALAWQPELALRVMVHALATDALYSDIDGQP